MSYNFVQKWKWPGLSRLNYNPEQNVKRYGRCVRVRADSDVFE